MRIWRLCRRGDSAAAFDGEGARRYGGRWNRPGTRVVYASSSLALAVLENLVHFDFQDPPAGDFYTYEVAVPDEVDIETVDPASLTSGWGGYPGPDQLKELGTAWASAERTAVLEVPSAVVNEPNYLLNPLHPDFKKLVIAVPESFDFDRRLFPTED